MPEGACRSVLMRSRMLRSLCTTEETLPHCGLGLPGYVQVTSPDPPLHRPARALAAQGDGCSLGACCVALSSPADCLPCAQMQLGSWLSSARYC